MASLEVINYVNRGRKQKKKSNIPFTNLSPWVTVDIIGVERKRRRRCTRSSLLLAPTFIGT